MLSARPLKRTELNRFDIIKNQVFIQLVNGNKPNVRRIWYILDLCVLGKLKCQINDPVTKPQKTGTIIPENSCIGNITKSREKFKNFQNLESWLESAYPV